MILLMMMLLVADVLMVMFGSWMVVGMLVSDVLQFGEDGVLGRFDAVLMLMVIEAVLMLMVVESVLMPVVVVAVLSLALDVIGLD